MLTTDYEWMLWLSALSLVLFITSLIAIPWLIIRLPANFFVRELDDTPHAAAKRPPYKTWLMRILRNLCGALLIAAGVLMLFLPGQGLLTLLFGLCLLDFPGKARLLRKLLYKIHRPALLNRLNRLRARYKRPPLQAPSKLQP